MAASSTSPSCALVTDYIALIQDMTVPLPRVLGAPPAGYGKLLCRKEELMALPFMPKATAVWLVENTSLTFDQIGDFCGLHPLEVQAIADGEVAVQMQGLDPIVNGQLTLEEIERCQKDPAARLKISAEAMPGPMFKHRGPRYTPIAKRQDKPDAIAWLLKSHPELSDGPSAKLTAPTTPDT